MNRAIKVFGFGLTVILLGCRAHQPVSPPTAQATPALSSPDDWVGYPWPPDGDLTGTAALRSLLELPTQKGNACEDYMALTNMQGQPLPHAPLEIELEGKKDEAMLKKLAADPEIIKRISVFRTGAKKTHCQTFGALYPWNNTGNPLHWKMPQYAPVMRHITVAVQYALSLAEQGKTEEAIAWLEDLVIVGWQFQQDVTLLANMVGIRISADAATALSQVLDALGSEQKPLVNAWRSFAGHATWRRYVAYKGLLPKLLTKENRTTDKTLRMLIDIARSEQMIRGMRAEAMLAISLAHLVRPGAPPATDLQKKAFESFKNQTDTGLAGAAKAFSYSLDLSEKERKKLAAEIDKQ